MKFAVTVLVVFYCTVGIWLIKNIFKLSFNKRIVGFELVFLYRGESRSASRVHSAEKLAREAAAEGKSRENKANSQNCGKNYYNGFILLCHYNSLLFDYKLDRTVIRAVDFGMYFCTFEPRLKSLRNAEIVNTPADILLPCLKAV